MSSTNIGQFPNYFADAETDYSDAEYVIFGCPYDKTSSFRFGCKNGPDAIRQATWNFESFDILTKTDLSALLIHDYGNIEGLTDKKPKDMITSISDKVQTFMSDNKIPVGIGGEHSTTPGIINCLPKDTFVIVFDAHLDFRESYENDSFNHACTVRRIADYIPIENIAVIGIRSAEKQEYQKALRKSLRFYESKTIQKRGIDFICKELIEQIGEKPVYISIDIDAVDPSFAPGVGTPEPFGIDPQNILTIFDTFYHEIIGFDLMELNPLFDHGQTAMLAAKIIRYGIAKVSKKDGV